MGAALYFNLKSEKHGHHSACNLPTFHYPVTLSCFRVQFQPALKVFTGKKRLFIIGIRESGTKEIINRTRWKNRMNKS